MEINNNVCPDLLLGSKARHSPCVIGLSSKNDKSKQNVSPQMRKSQWAKCRGRLRFGFRARPPKAELILSASCCFQPALSAKGWRQSNIGRLDSYKKYGVLESQR